MGRVIHFEITADDLQRAIKFYKEALGWEFSDGMNDGQYWVAKTGDDKEPGINGAIMPRSYSPDQPIRNTVSVEKLEAAIDKVKAAGGTIDGDIMDVPGIGRYVNVRDTEGNQFGMLEPIM